jgi:adenylylsulfate kinase
MRKRNGRPIMVVDSKARSLAKSLSWRLMGSLFSTLVSFLVVRRWGPAAIIGLADFSFKIALYFLHERAWNRISLGRSHVASKVIWLTGLSGAGKSTIALDLKRRLMAKGIQVEHLDGDMIREIFPDIGYSVTDRIGHVKRVGFWASVLERNNVFVIASFISPNREAREFARKQCKNFLEVYVSTPLEVCEARDPKGLYTKAREGQVHNMVGINSPYEPPLNPELVIDTTGKSVDWCVAEVQLAMIRTNAK